MLSPHSLWLVREPADIRAGIDSLTRLATQAAGHPPREGEAFLFTGKKRTRMKLLMWDRHGVWLCTRRLHPPPAPGRLPLAPRRRHHLVAHGGTVRLAYRRR